MIAWCCSMRCDRADCSTAGLVLAGARAASVGAARSAGVPSGVAHLRTFGHVVAGFGGGASGAWRRLSEMGWVAESARDRCQMSESAMVVSACSSSFASVSLLSAAMRSSDACACRRTGVFVRETLHRALLPSSRVNFRLLNKSPEARAPARARSYLLRSARRMRQGLLSCCLMASATAWRARYT